MRPDLKYQEIIRKLNIQHGICGLPCRCNGHLNTQELSLLAILLILLIPAQKARRLHLIEPLLAISLTNNFLLLIQFLLLLLLLMLSHSLHHFGVASRHLLWHVVLQNELKMLPSLTVQNFDVISACLIGLSHLLIVGASLDNCLRFDSIQIHLWIYLIDPWLERALCSFFFITFLFLNARHQCLLRGYSLSWLVLHTAILARSCLMGLLILTHLDNVIPMDIVPLLLLVHFLVL